MTEQNISQAKRSYPEYVLASVPIESIGLSRRASNALLRAGVNSVLELQTLIETDSLFGIRNVGPSIAKEIKDCMSLLLQTGNLEASLDEIDLFSNTKSESNIVPKEFFYNLPIDIIAEELGTDLLERLKHARFEKFEELANLAQIVSNFLQNANSSLDKLINFQKGILQSKIEAGKLHPQAIVRDSSIETWVNLVPEGNDVQLELLGILTQANEVNSLTTEMSLLFTKLSARDFEFYVKYFGGNITLEQIGNQNGITRERVRQIISKVTTQLWDQVDQSPCLYIQSALLIAKELGEHLSLHSWKELLLQRGLIDPSQVRESINLFDAFCTLLRSRNKAKHPPKIEMEEGLKIVLSSPSDLPLGSIKAIEAMPSKSKRKVRRQISYVGGIHLLEASDIFDVDAQLAADILKHLGFKEVMLEWYTIASSDSTSRWPILKGGLAMMEVCGPLEFNSFCDGIRRYISRFYDVLAPPKVIKAHLEVLGFELEDEYVCWFETPTGYLAESDQCFVNIVKRYGPVVSFQEVVEAFQEANFSIATATARVLSQSPIVERVETGLYILRGQIHTWEDIEAAKGRQESIDYDPEVVYGIDGIIRYRITIGSWGLNGAISISSTQQVLPDLGDGWDVIIENKTYGTARRDDYLIWGLGAAFNALDVQIGDRVELSFDAWEKPIIRLSKI